MKRAEIAEDGAHRWCADMGPDASQCSGDRKPCHVNGDTMLLCEKHRRQRRAARAARTKAFKAAHMTLPL